MGLSLAYLGTKYLGESVQVCRLVLVRWALGTLLIKVIHWPQHCDQNESDFLLISNLLTDAQFFKNFFRMVISPPSAPILPLYFILRTQFFDIGVKIFYMYMSLVWICRLESVCVFFLSDQQLWLNCDVCAVTVKLWQRRSEGSKRKKNCVDVRMYWEIKHTVCTKNCIFSRCDQVDEWEYESDLHDSF